MDFITTILYKIIKINLIINFIYLIIHYLNQFGIQICIKFIELLHLLNIKSVVFYILNSIRLQKIFPSLYFNDIFYPPFRC